MEKNFTMRSLFRKVFLFSALLFFLTNLNAQIRHDVQVSNNVFSPSSLTVEIGDTVVWTNIQGNHNVNGQKSTFPTNPESFGNEVGAGWTYSYVFNTPGHYDYRCDPHYIYGMTGSVTVNEPGAENKLVVNFTSMNPHIGETLYLNVVDQTSGLELVRVNTTVSQEFSIEIMGIENGQSYFVNFFADHDGDGMYDAPPVDHAWQLDLANVNGDETLNFTHNTNFTDIGWQNKLIVNFKNMNPHIGEMLTMYLKDLSTNMYIDTIEIDDIPAEFSLTTFKIEVGASYDIDIYADHNSNGSYDVPPADHAWRLPLSNVKGDTIVDFTHNTNFTDIMIATANNDLALTEFDAIVYPNPAKDQLYLSGKNLTNLKVSFFNMLGKEIGINPISSGSENIRYNIQNLNQGLYFVQIESSTMKKVMKFIKQ